MIGKSCARLASSPRFTSSIFFETDAPGTYPDGDFKPGATTSIAVEANVQPFNQDMRANLEEGIRLNQPRTIFVERTQLPLPPKPSRYGNEASRGDRFIIDDVIYDIVGLAAFDATNDSSSHYEIYCTRRENQNG